MLPRPYILQLPHELCGMIMTDCGLSRQEIGFLRLACKALNEIASQNVLYEKVLLSRLREERESFEKVADKYGSRVTEFVWREFDIETWEYSYNRSRTPYDQVSLIAAAARDEGLFWMPSTCGSDREEFDAAILRPSRPWVADWLSLGIGKMPNITTITIKPMSDDRTIYYDGDELWASQFKYFQGVITAVREHNQSRNSNDGVDLPSPPPRAPYKAHTLNIVTNMQRMDLWSILWNVGLQDGEAFQHLTTIRICALTKFLVDFDHSALRYCLRGSKNLKKLKICFRNPTNDSTDEEDFLGQLFSETDWPCLRSLHLVKADTFLRRLDKPLCGGIARQLHHLKLYDCHVSLEDLGRCQKNQSFPELKSIIIRSKDLDLRRSKRVINTGLLVSFLTTPGETLGIRDIPSEGEVVITDIRQAICRLCADAPWPNDDFDYRFHEDERFWEN